MTDDTGHLEQSACNNALTVTLKESICKLTKNQFFSAGDIVKKANLLYCFNSPEPGQYLLN